MASQYAAIFDVVKPAETGRHILFKQFTLAIHRNAVDLLNEPTTSGDTLTWARRVRSDPVSEAERWMWTLLENATFLAEPAVDTADRDGAVKSITAGIIPTMVKA